MRIATALALCLLLWGVTAAQTNSASDQPPTKENVLKFMEVLHLRAQLVQYFAGVKQQAKLGAEQGFKSRVPNATPEQLAKVDHLIEQMFGDMPVDEMLEAMIPTYQKHLTEGDLEAILAFYSSPVGQKLLREQPAMMQEGMQIGGEIGRRRLSSMMKQMDESIAKLAEEEQAKKPEPAPKN